jgi:thioredoxin reductase/ferredoxin
MTLAESDPATSVPVPPAPRRTKPTNPIVRYARWLHTQWPAGKSEKLPQVNPDGTTNVPGLYIVGDLSGIPLLKFSSDSGAKAVRAIAGKIAREGTPSGSSAEHSDALDLIIIGAGAAGMAAALEARSAKLKFEILDASEAFSTVINFPARKPIFTYPSKMTPAGELQFREEVHPKEQLLDDLRRQTRDIRPRIARAESVRRTGNLLQVNLADAPPMLARSVIVAIGRSGDFRKLHVPGEDLDKVYNRLHDAKDFAGQNVLVVGGGDSAIETAVALAEAKCNVTLSYRGLEFSRPKPANLDRLSQSPVHILFNSHLIEIRPDSVIIDDGQSRRTLPNDAVFPMIGRDPPLEFLRQSKVKIRGDWTFWSILGLVLFVAFCFWLYHWKSGHAIPLFGALPAWLDLNPQRIGSWFTDRRTLLGTIAHSASSRAFYYTLAYSLIVVIFGIRRIRRRRTPYVRWQTLTLMAIQVIPLFILPEIILPWLGQNGVFANGTALGHIANWFFEPYDKLGYDRAYWRSYGFVLAWPLFVYNWFTDAPMWGWLIIGFLQTFVAIPAMVYFWGKGAYCGWICSCGALAETLGDRQREKMPHGPGWNRLNMAGQVILLVAGVLMLLRIAGWMFGPNSWQAGLFHAGFASPIGYGWAVDLILAGVVGYGLYFWFSGRVWCRFFCPLAALMHIYARFGRFRILADKKKCISCNVCTTVCHQGIDVMSFANKGLPMADPQCVRCSACVQMCPTGVLTFGQVDPKTNQPIKQDPSWLAASPVLMREIHINGEPHRI